MKHPKQIGLMCALALVSAFPFVSAQALENISGQTLLPKKASDSATDNIAPMPLPDASDPTQLDLTNAVLLALRRNPNLKMDFNNRKVDRYSLLTAQQAFRPDFGLTGSYSYSKNNGGTGSDYTTKGSSIGPTVDWTLPTGTVIHGNYSYAPTTVTGDGAHKNNNTTWGFTITQHLLKGFGWNTNMVGLRNAHDDQTKADYTLENSVIATITQVMTDYYAVVQAKETITVDKNAYHDAKITFAQRKALYQAGRVSRSDLSQAELTATQKQTTISADQQKFNLAREKLMNDLNLPNGTNFHVDAKVPVKKVLPNLNTSIQEAIKNNLDLKISKIAYKEAQRNLLTSENGELPTLDLEYQDTHNNVSNTVTSSGVSSTTISSGSTVSLNLTVPLNRVSIDQKSLQSAIAMQNAQITFRNAKTQLKNSVITAVQNLESQWNQIQTDKINLKLAENNYKASQIKYQYGKINAFNLAQQQEQLQSTQNSVINDQISYLESVTNYEKLVGTVLPIWHIHLEGMKNATQI